MTKTTSKRVPVKIPKGLNKKSLDFCKKYVDNGGDYQTAYAESFSTRGVSEYDIKFRAKKLLDRAAVQSHIWELCNAKGKGYDIQREGLTESLVWALREARGAGDYKETANIVMDVAKLHGLLVDKHDIENNHTFQIMKDVTLDGDKLTFDIGQRVEAVERVESRAKKVIDTDFEEIAHGEDLL